VAPSNDHELAIARITDRIDTEGRLYLTSIPEIAAALEFMLTRADSEFLAHYLRWRVSNPIAR
jgi:hypothetical protein